MSPFSVFRSLVSPLLALSLASAGSADQDRMNQNVAKQALRLYQEQVALGDTCRRFPQLPICTVMSGTSVPVVRPSDSSAPLARWADGVRMTCVAEVSCCKAACDANPANDTDEKRGTCRSNCESLKRR